MKRKKKYKQHSRLNFFLDDFPSRSAQVLSIHSTCVSIKKKTPSFIFGSEKEKKKKTRHSTNGLLKFLILFSFK